MGTCTLTVYTHYVLVPGTWYINVLRVTSPVRVRNGDGDNDKREREVPLEVLPAEYPPWTGTRTLEY